MKYVHTMQNESSDCGIATIQTILRQLGRRNIDIASGLEKISATRKTDDIQGLSLYNIEAMLAINGVYADSYEVPDEKELLEQPVPMIVMICQEGMPHYCVIHQITKDKVVISNPAKADIEIIDRTKFSNIFMGYAVCIDKLEKESSAPKEESYPQKIIRETLRELPLYTKVQAIVLTITAMFIPILTTYGLEYMTDKYFDKVKIGTGSILTLFTLSLAVIFYFITKYNAQFRIDLGNKIEKKILSLYFNSKLNDIDSKKNVSNLSAYFWNIIMAIQGLLEKFYLIINLIFTGILVAFLLKYSVILAGLLLFWSITFFVGIQPYVRKVKKGYTSYLAQSNAFSSSFEESIRTSLDINIFQKNITVKEDFSEKMKNYFDSKHYIAAKEVSLSSLMEIARIFMLLSFVFVYSYLYSQRNIDLLAAISSGVYVLYIATSGLNGVFSSYLQYEKSKDAIEYIENKNDFKKSIEQIKEPLELKKINHIDLTNITFAYQKKGIFKNDNFYFSAGKIYGIMGDNGSGKSTLIKLLSGLIQNQSGEISLNKRWKGNDLSNTNILDYISMYTTEMDLYFQTIKNNALYDIFPNQRSTDTKLNYIKELGLDLDENHIVNASGVNISQGQKQKILLLRALNRQAGIYIFDEPTGNLDKSSELAFYEIIHDLAKNQQKIVIIVSHNETLISKCDTVYNLTKQGSKENE